MLTVTETSRGLNFEYKWEAGRGAEAFPPPGGALSPARAARLQELCAPDGAPPGVVPVLSAHSPSVGSEYFIRLEEPAAGHDPDCSGCVRPDDDDSDGSTNASLAMEPLLGRAPPAGGLWSHCDYNQRRSCARIPAGPSRSPSPEALMLVAPGAKDTDWCEAAFCPGFFEDPLCVSPSGSSGARPSPGGKVSEETRRAAQHRHWSSNVSANNNSGRGRCAPESWGSGCEDSCPSAEHSPLAEPEEDPGEPLLGPQTASPDQEPGHCHIAPQLCPVEGLAPSTTLSPWAEVAVSGDSCPEAEPRLAEEAGGSHEPQSPLPSVPSSSREGAPLPAEEAPDTLSTSPTQDTAAEPTGSSSPELQVPGSEDGETTEGTLGVFTDLSSDGFEKLNTAPVLRSLQKHVGTPDSLDSLDIPSSASDVGCELFSPSAPGPLGGQPRALDSGYDTENYESPEFVLKDAQEPREPEALEELVSKGESPGSETGLSTTLAGGLSEKNPYRDSAYFSDLDAESEPPTGANDKLDCVPCAPALQPRLESPTSQSAQSFPGPGLPGEAQGAGPREASPPPSLEETSPEPSACPGLQGLATAPPAPSRSRSKFFLLTPVPPGSENDPPESQEAPQGRTRAGAAGGELAAGLGASRAPLCLALPDLALEGRSEEDEEESEDSDESDEELRCYSVQEPSVESEEEAAPVPVVVAESQSARNLRSLLKIPNLLSEAFCEDLERKKKAVSFFDDVTVYLFDQESPTRELGEPFPGAKEVPPTFLAGGPSSPSAPGRLRRASDSAPDVPAAKDGGAFEWDVGFQLMPAEAALATALGAGAAEPSPSTPPKPATPGPFSRFTVSPTPGSRFSITHVSDSDVGAVGGPARGAGRGSTEA